jgi:hypothetical protein
MMDFKRRSPDSPPTDSASAPTVTVSVPLLTSLATGPVLGILAASRVLGHGLLELSRGSEEVFRGDRLPVLPFPSTSVPPHS